MTVRAGAIFGALLLVAPVPAGNEPASPEGWRQMTVEERSIDAAMRQDCEWDDCASTRGDWNGDGRLDGAILLIKQDGSASGLWAFFDDGEGGWQWVLAESYDDPTTPAYMGLLRQEPATFRVLCWGYEPCDADGSRDVSLTLPAIDVMYFESSGHYLVWNAASERFDEIWYAD